MRASVVLAGLCVALGCTQTDIIARDKALTCADSSKCADAGADASVPWCSAAVCANFDDVASRCSDGTSHVLLGDSCDAADPASPASRFALCACTDFISRQALRTDAWNGSDANGLSPVAASVAVNGTFAAAGALDIAGSLFVTGSIELAPDAGQVVADVIEANAPAACACDGSGFLDVGALVAAHADANANDNLQLGFDPQMLDGFTLPPDAAPLELGCGRYYFAALHGRGPLRLRVTGHAAIFVADDLAVDDDFTIELAPASAVDLFVAGNVRASARFTLGDVSQAGRARLYVGGTGNLDIYSDAFFAGSVYAPRAELVTRGLLTVYGSLFVRRAAPLGDVELHYDAARQQADSCHMGTGP